nr:hypothetical protein Iba_chr13bCG1930 [Ipomoea batatas]
MQIIIQQIFRFVYQRNIPPSGAQELSSFPLIPVHQMQKKLQVMDFCKVDPLFYERRFTVIQHKLFPHMKITPRQKLSNLLHKPRQAFVQQNPRHFRHRVVDVRHSQYFHSQFFHSLLESDVPNSWPGEGEHADGYFSIVLPHFCYVISVYGGKSAAQAKVLDSSFLVYTSKNPSSTWSQVGRLWSSREVLKSWMSANISRPVTVPLQAMVMSRRPSRIWKMGLPRRRHSTLEPCLHSGSARFLAENQRVPASQPSHFCHESLPRNLLILFQQGFDLLRRFQSHAASWLGFSGAEICISVQERRSPP